MKSFQLLCVLQTCMSLRFNEVSENIEEWSESGGPFGGRRRRRRKSWNSPAKDSPNAQIVVEFTGAKAEDADGALGRAFKDRVGEDLGTVAQGLFAADGEISVACDMALNTPTFVQTKMKASVRITPWAHASESLMQADHNSARATFRLLIQWREDNGWPRNAGMNIASSKFDAVFKSAGFIAAIDTAFTTSANDGGDDSTTAFTAYGITKGTAVGVVSRIASRSTFTGQVTMKIEFSDPAGAAGKLAPANLQDVQTTMGPYNLFVDSVGEGLSDQFGVSASAISITHIDFADALLTFQMTWTFKTTCNKDGTANFADALHALVTADEGVQTKLLGSLAAELDVHTTRLSLTDTAKGFQLTTPNNAADCQGARVFTADVTYSDPVLTGQAARSEGHLVFAGLIAGANAGAKTANRNTLYTATMARFDKIVVPDNDAGELAGLADEDKNRDTTLTVSQTDGDTAEAANRWNSARAATAGEIAVAVAADPTSRPDPDGQLYNIAAAGAAYETGNMANDVAAAGFADGTTEFCRIGYTVSLRYEDNQGATSKILQIQTRAQNRDGNFEAGATIGVASNGLLDIGVAVSQVESDGSVCTSVETVAY